ncbi:MAG: TonB C-terminal domain-containing protein [Candidatus Rokubacteria bacterium]|nr:TonB C-terminal domain-containing protein [Candidatus Rokubacteria bacterium]
MRIRLPDFVRRVRRRPLIGVVGSLLLHLAVLGALLLVAAPGPTYPVKRGEPLIVELPQADEPARRGRPGGPGTPPTPEAPRPATPPAPPAAKPAPPPTPPAARPAAPAVAAKRAPEQPRVASAAPAPAARPVEPAPEAPPIAPPQPAESAPPAAAPRAAEREPQEPGGPPRVATAPGPRETAPDIRSALRRGGPGDGAGGAGGRGEGRGGIEGEPIPLDSKDPKYNDYLDRVRRMIKDKWVFPCVKSPDSGRCEYHSAVLVIEFGIAKDGRVPFVTLRRQSGFEIMDQYAMNAIKLAAPFPAVPDALSRKGIPILARFSYVVDTSLVNVLR